MVEPIADFVVSMNEGGIVNYGEHDKIIEKNDALPKEADDVAEMVDQDVDAQAPDTKDTSKDTGKLILAEEVAEGRVSLDACKQSLVPCRIAAIDDTFRDALL